MARKPVYEFELDDEDEDSTDTIYDKYMEDISEILARAYDEIGGKVRDLVDELDGSK